ncbi:MAG: GNAT family N-acetyltransferase [Clostridia bacterium]|nr:GNAT family N-acetyltransferase [Clostridia bacterium]
MSEIRIVKGETVSDLRKEVFALEQGYPEDKLFDDKENSADFLACFYMGKAVGCGRFYKENETDYHIDNIAFGKEMRGKGMGRKLVLSLVDECKKMGAQRVTVNARADAVKFYEKCGFAVCGCEFTDENFSRVPMVKSFEFDSCSYVMTEDGIHAFYVRKTFNCANVASAIVRINAMGFVEPYFNCEKLTDEMFIPAWTNYEKRDLSVVEFPIYDTMTQRRYYLEYDITDKISEKNALVLHVGNGWYCQTENDAEKMPKWGDPKVIFKVILTMKDGSVREINSDASALWKESYIKRTNIYINETIDGRDYDETLLTASYDDSDWKPVNEVAVEPCVMVKQFFSGDKFDFSLEGKLIADDERGKLYDLCADESGLWIVRFDDDAKPGDEAYVSFSERIDENGDFLLRHTGGDWRLQKDIYICGETKREFSPVFTWRAGRYIRVEGKASLVRFDVVYSPVPVTAELTTSNENLRWFFDAYCNTQKCNIHGMIPSDCPHRERLGYTGDGQLCSAAGMTIFDSEKMYRKWLDDIADCQDIWGGHVQHTAPFYGGGGGPGGWGGAMVIVPWNFYKKFGDKEILSKYYLRMKKYLDYMQSRCDDNIVMREEEGGWCLGDWCAPDNINLIPEPFINTYFFIKCCILTKKSAEILGFTDDMKALDDKIKVLSEAFCREYYNAEASSFYDGIQGADAFALDIGLGDEKTLENLVSHYEALGEYDTGIFGTDIVTRVLFENGYGELAFRLMTGDGEISFANMKRTGTNTLWENWDGCDSLSHPMFGAASEYIFNYILGIRQTENSAGYTEVEINPADIPGCGDISGSIMTKKGKISVDVRYIDGEKQFTYSLPDGIKLCNQ